MSASASPAPQQVSQLQLHGVHALSCPNKAVLAACPTADHHLIATAANCFVVITNVSTDQQVQQLRSTTSNQPLQCLAWSVCGTHVAAGEAGSNPAVLVWNASTGQCVRELRGHKHTVSRLCFSPDGKLLASVGGGADGLCIWDWHTGRLLAKQKVAADTSSVVFTEDSSHILAAGKGTVKSWSLMWSSPRASRSRSSSGGTGTGADVACGGAALSLTARQVNLKQPQQQQRGSMCVVDLCLAPCLPGQPVGSNGVYALTAKGNLLLLRSTGRTVDRSINLQVHEAFGLAATQRLVACACSHGTVRLFGSKALAFKANLPYLSISHSTAANTKDSSRFADARGCSFGPGSQSERLLLVVYSSLEVILWDIHNLAQIRPVGSFASHTGCVWDVCPFRLAANNPSSTLDEPEAQVVSGCATCATDGSIRFWRSTGTAGTLQPMSCVQAGLPGEEAPASTGGALQPGSNSKVQLRCMRISHDGALLAAGDTAGNVHIYDLSTLQLVVIQEAHDLDVLCLDFSPPAAAAAGSTNIGSSSRGGKGLAVSGSRDTLIHVYDACDGFRLLETLDEHEAEVTAVRFTCGGRGLVSCGADHSIIFRALGSGPVSAASAYGFKVALRETLPQHLLHDLVVDPLDSYVLTADQNGIMRQWDAASGRVLRTMQPEVGAGKVVRLCMDPGGSVAICCHSDGCLRVYDVKTGRLMWRAWGHASLVAAAAVTHDLCQLVSVGGDGCVMVWALPDALVAQLRQAAAHVAAAKQQAGSPVALHRLLSSAAVDRACALRTTPAAGTPQPTLGGPDAAAAASSSRATPSSCASDGVLSSTLRRLQEGKSLVSADKLPRWARSPTAAAGSAAGQDHSSGGGGSQQPQQQRGRRLSKWLSGRTPSEGAVAKASGAGATCAVPPSPEPACASAAVVDKAPAASRQQPAALPWHCDSSRALVRHWSDGSSFNKEAAATAAAAAAVSKEASEVLPVVPGRERSLPQVSESAAAEEQQPDAPDKAQPTPAAPGSGAVVRDLFKSDFAHTVRGPKAARDAAQAADEDDCLTVQEGRGSQSQVSSPGPDSTPLSGKPSPDTPSSGTAEHSTGLTPQGSKLFRAVSGAQQPYASSSPPAATTPPATPATAQRAPPAVACDRNAVDGDSEGAAALQGQQQQQRSQPYSQEPSPREKRWRQGQMKPELAGMWERLESLQAQFVQQQAQATAKPSPVRPKSSLGHASPAAASQQQQQQLARRRSDSSAACQPAAAAAVAPAEELQEAAPALQQQQQPASPCNGYAAAASPKSPARGSLASRLQAVAGRRKNSSSSSNNNSSRQPWVSPTQQGPGKAAKRTVRCSPASSPQLASLSARRQAAAAAKAAASSASGAGGSSSTTPVFGSRTLARSMQRRRSSATDEEGAPASGAATTPASSAGGGAEEAVAASPTPALGAAAAQPPQAADRRLLAELLDDDDGDEDGAGSSAQQSPAAASRAVPQSQLLAELLEWDSPEAPPSSARHGAEGTADDAASAGSKSAQQAGGAEVPVLQLDKVLWHSSSSPRSPSLAPSDSSSPDTHRPRSLLSSSCSPQQLQRQQHQQRRAAPPSGKAAAAAAARVSSECRVSIGTSIAARSPAAYAAHGSPLAHQGSPPAAAVDTPPAAPAAAAAIACKAGAARADLRCSSVDLTPVPTNGLVCYAAADTPKVNMGGEAPLAAAGAAVPAACSQHTMLPADPAVLPGKAGVTVTPAGNTEVWPGWGAEAAAWEATPSPITAAVPVKKLWGAEAAAAPAAAASRPSRASNSLVAEESSFGAIVDGAATDAAAAAAPALCAEESTGLSFEASTASIAAGGGQQYGAPLPACGETGAAYWVQQNPCYDMTPHGSAGRGRGQEGSSSAGVSPGSAGCCPDSSSPALHHPLRRLDMAVTPGIDSAAAAVGGGGGRGPSTSGTDQALSDALGGVSRRTSFLSARDSVASSPTGTPRSACGSSPVNSEPGSVASSSSKGGALIRRPGSAGGGSRGRFSSSRALQSILGSHGSGSSPSGPSGPSNSDGGPVSGSPSSGSGMLGLLQRMKKLSLPTNRNRSSRSGGSSGASGGGSGCMNPLVAEEDDDGDADSGRISTTTSRPQQQQLAAAAAATGQPSSSTAQQVAATVEHFKHSIQEMHVLLQQLQGLSLDADSTRELNKLLTPGKARAAQQRGADTPQGRDTNDRQHQQQQQQATDSACSSSGGSPAVAAVSLQQRLQQEVLCSINELHAAITGLPLTAPAQGAGVSGSSPGTPAWLLSHGSGSGSSQLLASNSSPAGSSCKGGGGPSAGAAAAAAAPPPAWAQALVSGLEELGSGSGATGPVNVEDLSSRICEKLLQRLNLRGSGLAVGEGQQQQQQQ